MLSLSSMIFFNAQAQRVSLAGDWNVLLGNNTEIKHAKLPGTIDTNKLGQTPSSKNETTHLTRLSEFKGKAVYRQYINVPAEWKKIPIRLVMERTKPTWVYLDGQLIDSCNYISTPQRYILPAQKKVGRHVLEIVVDNSRGVPEQLYGSSHAYTEDTQTNWNGIIGEFYIEPIEGVIAIAKTEKKKKKYKLPVVYIGTQNSETHLYGGNVLPCFQSFRIEGHHFYANGRMTYLRGKHDACVWPLTGHVPMDVASWAKYLTTCQEYGINHVRFHSWCPPEAAFVAADSLGVYLQPELPFWGNFNGEDTTLMTFLHKEGENILREYGHHPSFRMMALGNELWGNTEMMKNFVDDFRKIAPDKYYTFGSNYFLGYLGIKEGMDYFTTCRIGGEEWGAYNTHTRGSFSFADAADGGIINHFYPSSDRNFDEACDQANVPIISHETGQFQTYPDYREIKKYTGVLYPYNLEMFRNRLKAAGMEKQADAFHRASGLWSVKLYKADIEMDLRTKNMAGFQLLDIQDYPGQGSAYVGILDAFMDSKGITTPKEWKQWCSPVVPLFVVDKYCYNNGDTLNAKIQVANYGGSSLKGKTVSWRLDKVIDEWNVLEDERTVAKGELEINNAGDGLITIGTITPRVFTGKKASRLRLKLDINGTEAHNEYDLWVYPNKYMAWARTEMDEWAQLHHGFIETNVMTDDIAAKLKAGAKVLWIPSDTTQTPHSVGALFQTDYWNYRMFKTISEKNQKQVSPGTLGILVEPKLAVFDEFPTESHTNWQWYAVLKNSRPLILDNFPKPYKPLVQVIDNIERNHKLGILMEYQVGKGKLLLCTCNLRDAMKYPEGKAFYVSLLKYMNSREFNPITIFTVEDLQKALMTAPQQAQLQKLDNISQY